MTSNLDDQIQRSGIVFHVMYVGCLSIKKSMKELPFEQRSALAKECITQVAEKSHFITAQNRTVPRHVKECISGPPDIQNGGSDVELFISTFTWHVKLIQSNEILFQHEMPSISFASAGDAATANFVAYVASSSNNRRCYVFDCASGTAQDIITAIGRAFALRFEQVRSPAFHHNPQHFNGRSVENSQINLNSPFMLHRTPPAPAPAPAPLLQSPAQQTRYVNENMQNEMSMSPFCRNGVNIMPPTNYDLLQREPWFHGQLSREKSEELVRQDGEFLVRQSENQPNQFVLTGMQEGNHRHLLLIDEDGNVRTKDRKFNDICDLIHYHRGNNIPISSKESALILRTPVNRHALRN